MGAVPRKPIGLGVDGLGRMGLATALALSSTGARVACYDHDPRVRRLLRRSIPLFDEPGIRLALSRAIRGRRIEIVDSPEELATRCELVFLCLPTSSRNSGDLDLRPLKSAVREVARAFRGAPGFRLLIVKSTIAPGTTRSILEPLVRRVTHEGPDKIGVAVNPEFLSEGSALEDALHPERIVVGSEAPQAIALLKRVYRPFRAPIRVLPPTSAELVKCASNAYLAMRVSFSNEMSRASDALGLSIDEIMAAVGDDSRIGHRYFRAGPGFGGGCLEKDLRALARCSRRWGSHLRLAEATLQSNHDQLRHVLRQIENLAGPLKGKSVTVLGVSFKAGTDDVRGSLAFPIVTHLIREGARVRIHDPRALEGFRRSWTDQWGRRARGPRTCGSIADALSGADLAVLHADWEEYASWRREWSEKMRRPVLLDLRRSVRRLEARGAGLQLFRLGAMAFEIPGRGGPMERI